MIMIRLEFWTASSYMPLYTADSWQESDEDQLHLQHTMHVQVA